MKIGFGIYLEIENSAVFILNLLFLPRFFETETYEMRGED